MLPVCRGLAPNCTDAWSHKLGLGQTLPLTLFMFGLRRIRPSAAQSLLRRYSAKRCPENPQNKVRNTQWEEIPSDPRPQWVYSTSAGLRLILIPSEYFHRWQWPECSSNVEKVSYFMPYSSPTLEIESMFLCPYVIITLDCCKFCLNVVLRQILKPRRWLQRQREAFFSITLEERKLVEESVAGQAHDETSKQDVLASSK